MTFWEIILDQKLSARGNWFDLKIKTEEKMANLMQNELKVMRCTFLAHCLLVSSHHNHCKLFKNVFNVENTIILSLNTVRQGFL